jgi:putative two-component system response regulator
MRKAGKILVVDDYEANLRGLGQLLRSAEYSVTSATNGRDALDLAKRERPDLVLLDVLMPGLSGVDVCRELKRSKDTCLTPVVLISGAQERKTILAGLDAGADDFLIKPVDAEELHTRVRSLMRLKRLTDELDSTATLFLTLGRIIEARDPYTEGHCERLAEYATALGRRLDLQQADIDALYRGAFLHDIGKIAIPDRVLLKKGKLTKKEFASMKRHAAIGDELLATVRSLDRVRPIVRHHHERIDGQGYPDGLRGDAIPLLAQIVSVVDVFDALTTDRLYRKALPVDTAYTMLHDKAKGGWCQTGVVDCFIDLHRTREAHAARARVAV